MCEALKMVDQKDTASLIKFYNLNIALTQIPYITGLYRRLGTFTSEDVGKWIIATGTVVQSTQTKTL